MVITNIHLALRAGSEQMRNKWQMWQITVWH